MIRLAVACLLAAVIVGGCASRDESTSPTASDPALVEQPEPTGEPLPTVSHEECEPDIAPEGLAVPNQDVVERTDWTLVLIGSCKVKPHYGKTGVSFTDGWAGLPGDYCGNYQSAEFSVDGRDFKVDPNEVSSTVMYCDNKFASGYLDGVKSWGIADNDRLYLLDRDGMAIFVATPDGPPGCIIDVPPNGRKHVAHGEAGCDTSGMATSLAAS